MINHFAKSVPAKILASSVIVDVIISKVPAKYMVAKFGGDGIGELSQLFSVLIQHYMP